MYFLKKDEAVACLKEILLKCQFSANFYTITSPENNIILKTVLDEACQIEIDKIIQKYVLAIDRKNGYYLIFEPETGSVKKYQT